MDSLHQRKSLIILELFFILILFTVGPCYGLISLSDASESTGFYPLTQKGTRILGPITLTRERGMPETEQIFFTVSDANSPFLLRLTNGTPEGLHRASSAVVELNGKEVFRPSEFNQKVTGLSRQVTLLSGKNLLEVRLRSAPGAFITLELYRLDNQACPIFGPKTFVRKKGKPVEEKQVFESKRQFLGPFTLNLINGDPDGSHRIDSAVIKLNGDLTFGPNSFNEQVQSLSQFVSVQSTNTLSVELRGKPGDLLTIDITGYDSTPPYVTIASPSNGAIFNASRIAVSGKVDDPSVSVTVNGVATPVASDGSFTMEGITLQEGENTIRVIATDACGNQGVDEILVYLRTVPQGPWLVLCIKPPIVPTFAMTSEDDCLQEALIWGSYGVLLGGTDMTAVSVSIEGIPFPDGVNIIDQGVILRGRRDGISFSAYVNIPELDGVYPFTAVATDANGGRTEATVTFIRDTVPPRLIITSPSDGLVTNNRTITITGTVDDPKAMVYAGWDYTEIPVVNGIFTTRLTLEKDGLNYIEFTAMDPAWNSTYVLLQIILDTTPPQININTPAQNATVNTLTIQVAGSIVDENIETINVAVNNGQPKPLTLTGSNFSGTVTLILGSNTLTFSARDKAGNQAEASITISVSDRFRVGVISPVNGATINKSMALIQGKIYGQTGEVGVTVNGLLAEVHGNDFAVIVPLEQGQNTLTAIATSDDGLQTQTSVTIYTEVQQEMIRLTVSPTSGVLDPTAQTLSVTLEAEAYLENPVASYSWDLNGDGVAEITGVAPSVIWEYQFPGLYFPRVTITDNQGNVYTETTLVNVLSREEMDTLLRNKWEGMKGALIQGDIEGAINYFDDFTKSGFEEHFTVLSPMLPQIVQELNDIQFIGMMKNAIEYDIRTIRNGIEYSFYLLFVRDKDGLWKIRSF